MCIFWSPGCAVQWQCGECGRRAPYRGWPPGVIVGPAPAANQPHPDQCLRGPHPGRVVRGDFWWPAPHDVTVDRRDDDGRWHWGWGAARTPARARASAIWGHPDPVRRQLSPEDVLVKQRAERPRIRGAAYRADGPPPPGGAGVQCHPDLRRRLPPGLRTLGVGRWGELPGRDSRGQSGHAKTPTPCIPGAGQCLHWDLSVLRPTGTETYRYWESET